MSTSPELKTLVTLLLIGVLSFMTYFIVTQDREITQLKQDVSDLQGAILRMDTTVTWHTDAIDILSKNAEWAENRIDSLRKKQK